MPESNSLWWMTAGLADETMTLLRWETGCRIQKNCPAAYRALPKKKKITDLGLSFGIWVEPEMVSVDSDLYRKASGLDH